MAGSQTFFNAINAESSSIKYASILNSENQNANTSSQNHKTPNSIISGGNARTTPALTVPFVIPYALASSRTYVFGVEEAGIVFAMDTTSSAISDK